VRHTSLGALPAEPALSRPGPAVAAEDARAALMARAELGERLEPEVVDTFVQRTQQAIDAAVDARMDERINARIREIKKAGADDGNALALAIVSLGTGIPITAIAAGVADLPGLVVAWAGIAAVNVAYAVGRRRKTP
jgi:hypothetical protein